MNNTGTTRACSKCGGDLKDRYQKQRYCLACHARYMREHRPKHKDLKPEAKRKANCRGYANVYHHKYKKLIQIPCADCGSPNSQKHHEDYNKPLVVIWLCRPCHLKRHQAVQKTA